MASQLRAQGFIDQLLSNGEPADLWQPVPVGDTHAATGGDKSHSVWVKTSTTVAFVETSTDIALANGAYLPRGSAAVQFDVNLLIPGQRAVLVINAAGWVRRAAATITRAVGTNADELNHPFVLAVETVRNGNTAYTDVTLVANSNAVLPFNPDSLLFGGTKPADGDKYGVAYRYHPQFDLLTGAAKMAMTGSDGKLIPVTLPLLEKPTGGDQ